jgi:hypothetical protein
LLHDPLIGHGELAIPHPTFDPPPLQRQVQDEDHPHEPAENPEGEPAEQVLLDHPQDQFTEQAALATLHAAGQVLLHQPVPLQRHVLVDPHPLFTQLSAHHALQDHIVALHAPFTGQAALAIPHPTFDPHPLQRQVQDEDHPHEPAENPEGEPAEQVLLDHPQDQFTEQAALAFVQLKVLVPPPLQRQAQVEFHPQEPATLDADVPAEQAY